MNAFFGNFELTIDEKNRLLIPVDVRRALDPEKNGNVLFLTLGKNGKPWIWPEQLFKQHAEGRGTDLAPDQQDLDFDHLVFACSTRLELDKQGRVLIPEKELKGIGKEITLSSARDHLEIWNRAEWDERRRDLEMRRTEIMNRSKQLRQVLPQEAATPEKK